MLQLSVLIGLLQSRLQGSRDRGATAVEYGLLVGLIAIAIVAVLLLLGPQLAELFQGVTDELEGAGAPAAAG